MKKLLLMLLVVVTIVVAIICLKYSSYKMQYNNILKENLKFEEYKDKQIFGAELGTIINKAVDINTKNKIDKDSKGYFITNEEDSIKIDIYIKDNEQMYQMETFYNSGMGQFIQHYGDIQFKCSKIEYHKKTNKIKYLLFEQIITS